MNKEMTRATKPTIQEASVVLSFAPGLTHNEMLRVISHIDHSCFPRIRNLWGVQFETHPGGDWTQLTYVVECAWSDDCRPLLEAFMEEALTHPEVRGNVADYKIIGARPR